MKSALGEPLLHFLLIGAALFLFFDFSTNTSGADPRRIVISSGEIEFLKASFSRTRQRQPTSKELQGLIDGYIREELLYREALALGLDKNDAVIRRRLKQKIEQMSDDIAGITVPSKEDLQIFMEEHAELFQIEPRLTLRQIYIDVSRRKMSTDKEIDRLLHLLTTTESSIDHETLGDSLMVPKSFIRTTESEISRLFGQRFSQELLNIEIGGWVGPIQSGYGLHLVLITERIPARLPNLDDIRTTVEWEWSAAHRRKLREKIYQEVREKYIIELEPPQGTSAPYPQELSKVQTSEEESQ